MSREVLPGRTGSMVARMTDTPSLPVAGASRRRLWGLVCLGVMLAAGLGAARADGAVLAGRVGDGRIPAPAAGAASVRAINPVTGLVVAAADVKRNGAWLMRVPNGPYTVLATVAPRAGAPRVAIAPIVRVRGSKPAKVRVSLKRTRAPKVRRRAASELGLLAAHATPSAPVVGFRYLTGPSANNRGKSVADLLLTDTVGATSGRCAPRVRELEHIDLVNAEISFSNSRYTDPATRIPRGQLLKIDLLVEGSIAEGADGSLSWNVKLRDAASGKIVGGDTTAVPAGGDWIEAASQTAARLVDQMCGGTYDINVNLRTDGTFATHVASGTLNATLTATGAGTGRTPPSTFAAAAAAGYEGVTFASTIGCAYVNVLAPQGLLAFDLAITPAGRLAVSWEGTAALQASASVLCPEAPAIPGQVGPSLVAPTPVRFELPVEGGSQAVGGGFTSGGDGWTHAGTITVTRQPPR